MRRRDVVALLDGAAAAWPVFCKKMAPKVAAQTTIASADAIALQDACPTSGTSC